MTHYRATRPTLYVGCVGENDVTARQGYYIHAESLVDAYRIMSKKFPQEEVFDFQIWDANRNTQVGTAQRVRITKEAIR